MSKKTIAIYGDSFANYELQNHTMGKSWVDLLEENYTVTNFGFPGNSVYQCYKTILSNHKNYDYNVFLIPVYHRFFSETLYRLLEESPSGFRNWFNNMPSIEMYKTLIEKNKNLYSDADRLLRIIDSVFVYWTEWKDHEFDETMADLMLNNIKKLDNVILINTQTTKENTGLTDISIWELEQLGFSEKYPARFSTADKNKSQHLWDHRKNHLSEENSFILYKKILDAIDNNNRNIKLSYTDFLKPSQDIDFYVRWKSYE